MRISQIRVQNYRSYRDQTIRFDGYSCLVGPNGSGKSTVLSALNILFRDTSSATNVQVLTEEDFHLRDISKPIIITATFTDLPDDAKDDFRAYMRHGQLVITAKAVWDNDRQAAEVKQYGERLVIREFAPFFDAKERNVTVAELKSIYENIRASCTELPPPKTKAQMESDLRDYEESHPELCELVPSEDQFYGWSKGANRLSKYCQWVYVPAVKDASEEQEEGKNTALGRLLQRSTRPKADFDGPLSDLRQDLVARYQQILDQRQSLLSELSASLEERLREWAHPGASVALRWHYNPDKSLVVDEPIVRAEVGEDGFLGEVTRLGHGLQRSFIVALLQELSTSEAADGPTLVLAIEEPELYQHPPQARHLASVLERLSEQGAQVVVTTHSPYFVSGRGFECVRMVRKDEPTGESRVSQYTYEELSLDLQKALGGEPQKPTVVMAAVEQILQPSQREMLFASVPILVEGLEDVAFVATQMHLMDLLGDFRRLGCHLVPCNGKTNMSRLIAVANGLEIPTFVIADGDLDKKDEDGKNARDNMCILRLCGCPEPGAISKEGGYWDKGVLWYARIGDAVKDEVGVGKWAETQQRTRIEKGLTNGVKEKNPLLITATLEQLWNEGHRLKTLTGLCKSIITFACNISRSSSGERSLKVPSDRRSHSGHGRLDLTG